MGLKRKVSISSAIDLNQEKQLIVVEVIGETLALDTLLDALGENGENNRADKLAWLMERWPKLDDELLGYIEAEIIKRTGDGPLAGYVVEFLDRGRVYVCPVCGSCGEEGCCGIDCCKGVQGLYCDSNKQTYLEMEKQWRVMWNALQEIAGIPSGVQQIAQHAIEDIEDYTALEVFYDELE